MVTSIDPPCVTDPEYRVIWSDTDLRLPPVSRHKGVLRGSTVKPTEVGGRDEDRWGCRGSG